VEAAQERLAKTNGARLVRMSGSGPSVFSLYETMQDAEQAAAKIRAEQQDCWVVAARLR
jgi:4-diphosphocytidyl-2-C-methyl-D-erythritol kinase